jgi:hypothetical protein
VNRFWFLKLSWFSFDFRQLFKILVCFMPNLLRDSQSLGELTTESAVLEFSVFWVSGPLRNTAKCVNISRRFLESPRMIDTDSAVLREYSSTT